MLRLIFILFCLLIVNSYTCLGQVTTNGGSGLSVSYLSLEAAITALNTATISSPVVITLNGNGTLEHVEVHC